MGEDVYFECDDVEKDIVSTDVKEDSYDYGDLQEAVVTGRQTK